MSAGSKRRGAAAPWRGTAFLVEACLLLAVVVGAVVVFAALFARAGAEGARAEQMARAVVAARDAAELFAADGADASGERAVGDLLVSVETSDDEEVAGLQRAVIVVTDSGGAELYRLETARAGGDRS